MDHDWPRRDRAGELALRIDKWVDPLVWGALGAFAAGESRWGNILGASALVLRLVCIALGAVSIYRMREMFR